MLSKLSMHLHLRRNLPMGNINYILVRNKTRKAVLRNRVPNVGISRSGLVFSGMSSQSSNVTYNWTVAGATIVSGQGTAQIVASGPPTSVTFAVTNADGKTGTATIS